VTTISFAPSTASRCVSAGTGSEPSIAWPPVIATASLTRILNVMFWPEATAKRTANDAEWKKVPSPTF
jgi:hypothetical protein